MSLLLIKTLFFLHPNTTFPLPHLSAMASAFASSHSQPKPRLKDVVFDMDGTLTVPVIDFPAMYRAVLGDDEYWRVGAENPSGIDILHHIEGWSSEKQQKAYEIIADFEREGLDRLQIMPGAAELCSFLDSKKLRRGLITRNVKASVDLFHQRFGLIFSPALSREYRPYKPDPAPLLHICSSWEVHPSQVMMIGDSLEDDVPCGKRAGAFTCLLDETGRYNSAKHARWNSIQILRYRLLRKCEPFWKRISSWLPELARTRRSSMEAFAFCPRPMMKLKREEIRP